MPETDDEIKCDCALYEPAAADIGCCLRCDCDISIHDAHDGLCAVCDEVAE